MPLDHMKSNINTAPTERFQKKKVETERAEVPSGCVCGIFGVFGTSWNNEFIVWILGANDPHVFFCVFGWVKQRNIENSIWRMFQGGGAKSTIFFHRPHETSPQKWVKVHHWNPQMGNASFAQWRAPWNFSSTKEDFIDVFVTLKGLSVLERILKYSRISTRMVRIFRLPFTYICFFLNQKFTFYSDLHSQNIFWSND